MAYKNPEDKKKNHREWYLKNKEKKNMQTKLWAENNKIKMIELQAEWYKNNKEKVRAQTKAWAEANPERVKEIQKESCLRTGCAKEWKAANKPKLAAYSARRRAVQLNATPAWLTDDDHWLAEEFYQHRDLKSKLTGVVHEVDHIVPLISARVCGLHAWWNLRVITASANRSKGNKL